MTSDRGLLLLRVSGWYGSFVEELLSLASRWLSSSFDTLRHNGAGVAEVRPGQPGLHVFALRPPVKFWFS